MSALAAIVTASIAAWSLVGSRRDSRDRSRPLVIASLRKGPTMSHGTTYLVIENVGSSVARDVGVSFDPPLPNYETTDDGQPGIVGPFLRKRYSSTIPMIAPGHRMKNVYSYHAVGVDGNVEPVPDQFTVTVRYSDDRGRPYQDSFPIDRERLGYETQTNPADTNDPVKRQNKALEAIAWELWE
ncbi:hypothetical protein [Pseudactinotalea sp. Z1748]|uniref:hypothetical protein n=1 Tax=Pseudactinotalea sp. Z1748 TaxID=3413027 RepID=UPI003C7E1BEF